MKKPTFFKIIFIVLILSLSLPSFAQNEKDFLPRFDRDIKGDILLIGNNILSKDKTADFNDSGYNSDIDMQYVNIDNGATVGVFSSSSAKLTIPNSNACYKIVYAGLYWSAILQNGEDRSKINTVKLKMPSGGYNDIKGSIIYDAINKPLGSGLNKPYVSYADVTYLLTDAAKNPTPQGSYTVANVISSVGKNGGTGLSAGWSLFVVYEDPTLSDKSITSFDGFSAISDVTNLDITIAGFKTILNGPVRAKLAFAALEGDKSISGDFLQINGKTQFTNERVANNFFNSSVTSLLGNFTDRTPKSTNTLGFDAGVFEIYNPIDKEHPGGTVIGNNQTSAVMHLASNQDVYFYYFNAFAVDIIAPKIVLTKTVKGVDKSGVEYDISSANVNLGQEIRYEIAFQNQGNDDAKNFTITDILPINVKFNYTSPTALPNDILILPNGVTVASYNSTTRTIVFNIDPKLVKEKGAKYTIKFRVKVVTDCNELSAACSNEIKNTAISKYTGTYNTGVFGEGSFSSNSECNVGTPSSTNFLVDIDKCSYNKQIALCGLTETLTAANGYTTYVWKDPSGTVFGGNNQSVTINKLGDYTVSCGGASPCKDIVQTFTVVDFVGSSKINPISPYAGNLDATGKVEKCDNNGNEFPKIFLCGKNDTRLLDTKITGVKSIVWQETKDVPPIGFPEKCAYEAATNWTDVGTGSTFLADRKGTYRLIVTYNNKCVNVYYYNVYQNLLNPTYDKQDIVCNTKGKITITNPLPSSGYEYSLDGVKAYQASNEFLDVPTGKYDVHIRQVLPVTGSVSKACVFKVEVTILEKIFSTTISTTDLACAGDKGTIKIAANGVEKQYRFTVKNAGTNTIVGDTGLIDDNYNLFSNLNPGKYDVETYTKDGCYKKETVEILDSKLTATAALTKELTCESGEITVTVKGGTPRAGTPPYYYYYVNNSSTFQTSPIISVPTAGNYVIRVVDDKGCEVTTTPIKVVLDVVEQHTYTATNPKCYGENTGAIILKVTNANGYTLAYSIDNGFKYEPSGQFDNLSAGIYKTIVRYTMGTTMCYDTMIPVTITAPGTALTASGGVSELAGCLVTGEGKLRITNPQGGTPFAAPNLYEYSFDGSNWSFVNEKYVLPGKYTLYVRDAKGCVYIMDDIILEDKPTEPTIKVSDPLFNCNGSANSTVTVTNPASSTYSYNYYLNGVLNTNTADPKTFLNVPASIPGTPHKITVEYKLTSVPTPSNLLYENFGYGDDTTSPGINTFYYCQENQVPATKCRDNEQLNDGDYTVTTKILKPHGAWVSPSDHTPATVPPKLKGRFLAVNIGSTIPKTEILYKKDIKDIIPNRPINFEFFAMNLLQTGNGQYDPDLLVALVDATGKEISSFSTGNIPKTQIWEKYPKTAITLDPGLNTNLTFIVRSNVQQDSGNDVAFDDIKVYQLPKSCTTTVDFPFVVAPGNKFTAAVQTHTDVTCAGMATPDGSITITATNFKASGFEYTTNNWVTTGVATTSPFTITGLSGGLKKLQIRYDATSVGCSFPFDQDIKTPAAIVTDVIVKVDAKCTVGATLVASATGGTGAYEYQLTNDGGTAFSRPFQNNDTFLDIPPGDYVVTTRDANKCIAPVLKKIKVNTPAVVTAIIVKNTGLCFDGKATITVNVAGGTGTYSFQTSSNGGLYGGSSAPFSGPSATFLYTATATGTYKFKITDTYGCSVETAAQVINAKLTANAVVSQELDCDVTPNNKAVITGTILGGTAPFTVTKISGTGPGDLVLPTPVATGTTFSYTTAIASAYKFEITDFNGCITTAEATVDAIANPTASATKVDPTCFNDANGQVQLAGVGGSGGYKFSFNSSVFDVKSLYTLLDAKTTTATTTNYTYQVQDSKGCISPVYTITLNNPTPVVAAASIPVNSNCSTTTLITSSGSGGAGGYTYSFNGSTIYTPINTLTVTNTASAQTITYSVKDSKRCIATKTIVIPAYNPPTEIKFSGLTTITCLATTTSVKLTPINGVGPFSFQMTAPSLGAVQNSDTFTNLSSGNYTFQVTDSNGCKISASLPIAPAAVIAVSGSKTDVKCIGATNGTATFTVTGASAVGNYTYTLSPNSGLVSKSGNVITVTGLGAGSYDLRVKDNTTGCISDIASVTINPATAIIFTAVATKINCKNKISTISFPTLSGGTPGYTYAFVTSGSTAPLVGDYSSSTNVNTTLLGLSIDVYVKDNNNCIATKQTIAIGQEDAPTIATPVTQCYTGTLIAITITGTTIGTASYSIDGVNYGSSPNFNLGVGSHTLYIKDQFGCTAQTSYEVKPQLTVAAIAATDVTCTSNTTINLSANGGTGSYTYAVSNGGIYTPLPSNSYVTAIAGTYTFKVTDTANPACSAVSTPVIVNTKATVITINTSKTDVKCFGDNTGIITITSTSGKAPYTYSVTKGGLPISTTATTTGLVAGSYNIVVTDALGCNSASTAVSIAEPSIGLTASATAPATTSCSPSTLVTVTGAGGTGTYTYSINGNGFGTSNTLVINDNGTTDQIIPFQVRDANGCTTVSATITVKKLNPPKISLISGTAITCNTGQSTSNVSIATTNGLTPLAFVIVSGPTINTTGATDGKFLGLASGTYLFKVTDANGCSNTKSYKVDPVTPIDIKGQNVSNVLCNTGKTGIAKYTITGFSATGNYTVLVTTVPAALPNIQTPVGDVLTLSNLGVGSYTVKVTDKTTGCFKDDTVIITEPLALTLVLASNVNANCSVATSKVTVTAGGGTSGYTYAFKQDGVAPIATDYGPSFVANLDPSTNFNWDVWTKDSKGCETKLDVAIAKDLIPTVSASVQNQCIGSGSSFVIKAVGAAGVGPYTYTINTGVAPSPADTFTVAPGTYTITVKDANNCPNTVTITVYEVLTANALLTKDLTCSPAPTEATIVIKATGGKSGYSYRVSSDGGLNYSTTGIVGNLFTTNSAGTFQFEVTDFNVPACVVFTTGVKVTTPDAVTASFVSKNPTCNGFKDGSIKLTPLSGVPPFTYSITGATGPFVDSNVFGGLVAGSYDYAVKDKKGCIFNDSTNPIVLVDPAKIAVGISQTAIICDMNTPGSFSVNVNSGGNAPYVYTLYDDAHIAIATYTEALSAPNLPHKFAGLNFGYYYIGVVDAKGCEFNSDRLRIETLPLLTITGTVDSNTCLAGVDYTATTTGGIAPYRFSIFKQTESPAQLSPVFSFTGLAHNTTYYLQVKDVNGCIYIKEITTPKPPSDIKITGTTSDNVTCNGTATGKLAFTVRDYDATVTKINYEVLNALTLLPLATPISGVLTGAPGGPVSENVTTLNAGNYVLKVTEVTTPFCSNSYAFSITQPSQALFSAITDEVNANCSNPAQLTLTTTGGTGPYKYGIAVAPATPSASLDSNVLQLDYSLGNNWNILVEDVKGCKYSISKTISKDPEPKIALNIPNKCAIEGAFSIEVSQTTAGVGTYYISINSSTAYQAMPVSYPGTPFTVTGLNSGLNEIYVKDSNGCFDKKSVTIAAPLKLVPSITALPTCADNDGTITLTGTGGTNSYVYSISPVAGTVTANVISGLPAGTYIVTMTDATNVLCSTTATVELSKPNKPLFSTTVNNTSCFANNDGIITVNLTGVNLDPAYTYAISPSVGVQTGNVFSSLPAGIYTITVTSGRVCSTSDTNVEVKKPLELKATAVITDYACSATNIPQSAKVTVNVDAIAGIPTGTGPYKYNFDGSATYLDSNEIYVDNGAVQTIHFYVKDFNGCLYDNTVDVNPFKKITAITFTPKRLPTCPDTSSDVSLAVVGGYTISKYEILLPATQTGNVTGISTGDFTGLLPNTTYLFKVTDANGCSFEDSYFVKPVTPIAIVGELANNISCNAANGITNNGTAKYRVTGFSTTGNYDVAVTTVPSGLFSGVAVPVADVITLPNLSAGSYNVAVTDRTTGCTENATVVITTPVAIAFTAAATKVFCSKEESQITVSGVTGGTGAYKYAVETTGNSALEVYSDSKIFTVDTNLTDLSWDVYVKDAEGCVEKKTVPVIYNTAPTIIVPDQQCFTGGSLTVDLNSIKLSSGLPITTVYAGVKTYTLNGSDLATSTATFTASGTYKLGIRDDNGCEAFVDYSIQKQLDVKAILKKDLYCTPPVNATIDVEIEGGVGTYSSQLYSGIAPAGTPVGSPVVGAIFTANVTTAGDYYFVTTDSNVAACTVTSVKVTVNTPLPTAIVSTPITQPILCMGGTATLKVNVDATIGLEPYTYTVTKTMPVASLPVVQLSNAIFTGLFSGDYTITVTDAKGCISASASITIDEPKVLYATVDPFPVNTTCSVATEITVVGHDGTPIATGTGYYYSFNGKDYTTSNKHTVNDDGTIQKVTFTVKDANGCETVSQDIFVNPLNEPTDLDFSASPIYCFPVASQTSTVKLTTTNGVGTLAYTIVSGPVINATGASSGIFMGLTSGDYIFKVTDSNGCSYQELFPVKEGVKIATKGDLIAGVACKNDANGAVTFTVSGFGALGFTNTITGVSGVGVITPVGTDTFVLTNLLTGTYQIDVEDNETKCVSSLSVFVPEPAELKLDYGTDKNANCDTGAIIKATASGGTAGYTYAFVKSGDPIVYTDSETATLDPAFTWVVWAKDAHGCEVNKPITIIKDASPSGISVNGLSQCPSPTGDYTFTIVAIGVGTLEYSIGKGFQPSATFTVKAPGTYPITVRDKNGCTNPVAASVTILEPLELLADLNTTPSCLTASGEVTLTAKGGTIPANFQYSKDGGVYGPSNVFSGLVPRVTPYQFSVKDMGTGCTKEVAVTIEVPNTAIAFTLSEKEPTCKGTSDGSIAVILDPTTTNVNSNPIYKYTLSGTVTRPIQEANLFSGLPAGTYTVTVTSGKGCSISETKTIGEPDNITFATAPVVSQYGCAASTNATNYAVITVSAPTGGSNSFPIYEFIRNGNLNPVQKGDSPTYTEVDLLGGSYTINVYDSKGCFGTTTATINPFVRIDVATLKVDVTKAITCANLENIKVSVNTTGTTTPMPILSYNVKGLSAGSSYNVIDPSPIGEFNGLLAGNYLVTITNPITKCSVETVHYVSEPNTFELQVDKVVDVKCFGSNEGSVKLTFVDKIKTPKDDAGEFIYTIVDALGISIPGGTSATDGTAIVSGLKSGIYTVTARLTGTPFCTVTKNFSIDQPTEKLDAVATSTAITCATGNNDGTISVTATGGWSGDYLYELVSTTNPVLNVGYSAQTKFTGLKEGLYTVNVKDSKGCIVSKNISLVNPTLINAVISTPTPSLTCFGDEAATITIANVTGGSGNYRYTLLRTAPDGTITKNGPQQLASFSNLGAGTYVVSVSDDWTCSNNSNTIVIIEPKVVLASLAVKTTATCNNQATITLSAIGGTGLYSYSADAAFTSVIGSFGASVTFAVPSGAYNYYVRDANGCKSYVTNSIQLDPVPALVITTDIRNAKINCTGEKTGAIIAKAEGGLGNYSYTLLNGAGVVITPAPKQDSPGNFTNLSVGNYLVRVDSQDCSKITSTAITISEPVKAVTAKSVPTPITCNGSGDGKITVTANGGTGSILYAISPRLDQFFTTNTFVNLKPGSYDIISQDENSCFVFESGIVIKEPNAIAITTFDTNDEICYGDKDGSITIDIVGGVAPYNVKIDDEKGAYIPGLATQSRFTFSGLVGGSHTIYIQDTNLCTTVYKVDLKPSVFLDPKANLAYGCLNNSPSNTVTVTIDASNSNAADVDYALDGASIYQVSNVFTNVGAGKHTIQARHTNGCIQTTKEFTIEAIDPLKIALKDGGLNEIVATATGGSGTYQFTFAGEATGTKNTYIYYKSGNYTVTVTDANGCVASETKYFEFIDIEIPNVFTPNGDGTNEGWAPQKTENYKDLIFLVFDRYGRKLGTYRQGQAWDGKYNNTELPSGDYWYIVKLNADKDAREFVGHFTLYR
jgi:gliding motility-associated-like protein/uncharacterized repeat protein (TIGR01451 family)